MGKYSNEFSFSAGSPALYSESQLRDRGGDAVVSITQMEFQALMAQHGLYIHYNVEDLREEVASLKADGLL